MPILRVALVTLHCLHAVLDLANVDRINRAESGNASVVYSVAERIGCLARERDHAREQLRLMREPHVATVARACELQAQNDRLRR